MRGTLLAAAFYAAVAIVMTWPVATRLTVDLPGDLGDPAFVSFVLAWGSAHWLDLLSGDPSAVMRFWNAPLFYPEPLSTAFSEHFALHSLLTLPVFAITHNAILSYNLLFLATFTLSGLSMFLLVRDLTQSRWAALAAGLAFAYMPYRISVIRHLQVLSSFWMPLALLGLHRFFETRRRAPLGWAAAALLAQNLASGYYLVFFGPFVGVYALAEMTVRRRLGDLRTWLAMLITGAAAVLASLPFAWPYLTLQRKFQYRRPLGDIEKYSADFAGWLTASPDLHLWGWLRTLDRPEGWLFPGLATTVLAIAGLIVGVRRAWRTPPDTRARIIVLFALVTLVLSIWLALGPTPTWMNKPVGMPSLYRLAYDYVPGYDIARVPSRMVMIGALATSLLAGLALAACDRPRRRWIIAAASIAILADAAAMPVARNVIWTSSDQLRVPEARIYREHDAPQVYRYLRTLPANAVLAHFPFGFIEREIQYTYYSAMHGRRMINGYSGNFPLSYVTRFAPLGQPMMNFPAALGRLRADGVTHVIVHTSAWVDDTGTRLVQQFEAAGAMRLARFGDDVVMQLAP